MAFILKQLNALESTNSHLLDMFAAGEVAGNIAVSADYQSGGKGLGTNRWYSDHGLNLLFSFGWCPLDFHPSKQFLVTQAATLAILDSLKELYPKIKPVIKWPNDIWVGNQKLAGILVSNIIEGNKLIFSVIGIGVNVNQTIFPAELPNPVSLKSLLNMDLDRVYLLNSMLQHIDVGLMQIENNSSTLERNEKYLKNLMLLNTWQPYVIHDTLTEACIRSVNEFGQLMLEHKTGEIIAYGLKEVKFVIAGNDFE